MTDGTTVGIGSQDKQFNRAFLAMTDSLMDDYDVVDLLSTLLATCTQLLDVQAGGILLVDTTGELELVASTSEEARVVETIIVAAGAGPCFECFNTASAVSVPDIRKAAATWPAFAQSAEEQGFHSTYAVPMRLRDEVIGVMNLLSTSPGPITERDGNIAQALADIAVLGILHERNFRDPFAITEQLHIALDTRILIEQAKGVLAQAAGLTMTDAFNALRSYARTHSLSLRATAEATVRRTLSAAEVAAAFAR